MFSLLFCAYFLIHVCLLPIMFLFLLTLLLRTCFPVIFILLFCSHIDLHAYLVHCLSDFRFLVAFVFSSFCCCMYNLLLHSCFLPDVSLYSCSFNITVCAYLLLYFLVSCEHFFFLSFYPYVLVASLFL